MLATLQALLADLGVIAILIAGWSYTFEASGRLPPFARSAAMAVAATACAVLLMSIPIQLTPGVIVDLRAVPIALAAFYGGPIVGIAVAAGAALFRLWLGGAGAYAAVIGMAIVAATGIVLGMICSRRADTLGRLVLVAATIGLASISGVFFLPDGVREAVFTAIAVPGTIVAFFATLLVSGSIAKENRRLAIAAENRLYRSLVDACPEPLNGKHLDGRFFAANPATAELMQAGAAAELIGKSDFDYFPRDVAEAFRKDEEVALALRKPTIVEQHARRRDGSSIWISTLKVALTGPGGAPIGLLTHNRDITELKQLQVAEERTRAHLHDALAGMADALALFDEDGGLILCNPKYRSLFPTAADGGRFDDMLGAAIAAGDIVKAPDIDFAALRNWTSAFRQEDLQHDIVLADGRIFTSRCAPGSNGTFVLLLSDVTRERKAHRELVKLNGQLTELSRTDALTRLANRRVFDETLSVEVGRSIRTGSPLTLLLIDVDFFKSYNDSYGHVAGDKCLRNISRAISKSVHRPGDLVARYGGEEFAAILPDTDENGARSVADRVRTAISELAIDHPLSPHGRITVSIGGFTFSSAHGRMEPASLIEVADRGLYAAKAGGRNGAVLFPAAHALADEPSS